MEREPIRGLPTVYKNSLIKSLKEYNRCFLGKNITYNYKSSDNRDSCLKVVAKKSNFMHLCGIQSYSEDGKKKNASLFYDDCCDDRIVMKNVWYKTEDEVIAKNTALESLELLFISGVRVGGYGRYEKLEFDHVVQSRQMTLAIGLVCDESSKLSNVFLPKTTINLRIDEKGESPALRQSNFVNSIKIIDIKTKEKKFITCTPPPKKNLTKKQRRKKKKEKQQRDRGNI